MSEKVSEGNIHGFIIYYRTLLSGLTDSLVKHSNLTLYISSVKFADRFKAAGKDTTHIHFPQQYYTVHIPTHRHI